MANNPLFKTITIVALMLLSVFAEVSAEVKNRPQRIVSISLCSDQLLLMLADRSQIASLTTTASDKQMSYMVDSVGNIPLNSASVEEIVPFQPDLVIGTQFAARDSTRFLSHLGYNVKLMNLPTSVEQVYELLETVGEWTGNQARAASLITGMKQKINQIQIRDAHKPIKTIIIYSPNGYTIGANTLENDVLEHAGFRNLAAEMGINGFEKIPLEKLIAAKPQVLQIDNHAYSSNSMANAFIGHPALAKMVDINDHIFIPWPLRACAGPMVTEAIAFVANKR